MGEIRVRFAPSPTGFLHVGGARTALFNWLFARHSRGRFILRIEDTDRERSKPEYEQAIIADLQWLGLDWDEGPVAGGPHGPYRQSERISFYREQLEKLLASGGAYPCFCAAEGLEKERAQAQSLGKAYRYSGRCRGLSATQARELQANGSPFSVRLRVPEGKTRFEDLVRGDVAVDHAEIDDFILARSGGDPTYNFVVAVDDSLMGISHVIRGEDHISNTPKQILIYKALGLPAPIFAHIPLILGPDRRPLSKRHGASALGEFKRQGYLPEALMNYLALLGWSFDDKTEIFSKDDLVGKFGLERVVKSAACFDYEKLKWMNGQYIRAASEDRIYGLCVERLLEADAVPANYLNEDAPALRRMIGLVKSNLRTISEIGGQLAYFLGEVHTYDPKAFKKYAVAGTLTLLERVVGLLEGWGGSDAAGLEEKFRDLAAQSGGKLADYVHPTRLAITGGMSSPGLFELIEILGKERCIARLKRFSQAVQSEIR